MPRKYKRKPFDPSREDLEKAKEEYLKRGGKITKIDPPKFYFNFRSYRSVQNPLIDLFE